jgi:hypothetical protein
MSDNRLSNIEQARSRLATASQAKAVAFDEAGRSPTTSNRISAATTQASFANVPGDSLTAARNGERAARWDLLAALSAALETDPADDVAKLDAKFPIVLLPVRLETRFSSASGIPELLVRVYPDEIHADTHEPALSDPERQAGITYWKTSWDAAKEAEAWQALVTRFAEPRSAWIVLATTPTNVASRPNGAPSFPATNARPGSWTRAAEARLLPDRWLVIADRDGGEVTRAIGNPIIEPLAMTLAPDADPDDTVTLSDDLKVDPEIAWAFDFAEAERVGMGLRVPISDVDATLGFDRLLVVGVKTTGTAESGSKNLTQLLDNHHYGRGMAFVPTGTPTNNTEEGRAGYPPKDPGGATSFAIERGDSLAIAGGAGTLFTSALGIPTEVAAHLGGADRIDQPLAGAMNNALWPATFGYALDQLMAPVFGNAAINEARQYFVAHVRGRGHLSAIRIGSQPYGVLPVSSLSRWQSSDTGNVVDFHLPNALRTLRPTWLNANAGVPRVGRTGDADRDLLEVLGMDAAAREVRIRWLFGHELYSNILQFTGTKALNLNMGEWNEVRQDIITAALNQIGQPTWQPRILGAIYGSDAPRFRHPLVADLPLSETDPLPFDYISAIRKITSISALRSGQLGQTGAPPDELLYLLLRHSALVEYARIGFDLRERFEGSSAEQRRESELVEIFPDVPAFPTVWAHLDQPVAQVTGQVSLGNFLLGDSDGAGTAPAKSFRASLQLLEGLPTAELERLFTETLDTCSHRLDAWISSLPAKRLEEMRANAAIDSHLGAYGWVEDLRPAPGETRKLDDGREVRVPVNNGGHIVTPSMDHASAAAVLRSGYLTRGAEERSRYAVNLSSARVRAARDLLDAVRLGQPLGAVLGYRFERGLHEGHRPLELDKYIEPFRRLYPLIANKADPTANEPAEEISARNVVDGLALRLDFQSGTIPFGTNDLPASGNDRDAIEAELEALDQAVDAVADLLTAESVFQLVRGNTASAGATLDAMAQGVRPPDPEFAQHPRGGTLLTHRVAIVLGGEPLPLPAGWPTPQTPRAKAEPYLDGWVGQLIGDPRKVRCRVSFRSSTAPEPSQRLTRVVSLGNLRLRPLDVLSLAQAGDTSVLASELDARVAAVILKIVPDATDIQITYAGADNRNRNAERTFPEVLELARSIASVVGGARQLVPSDLLLPEIASSASSADLLDSEANTRATGAQDALKAARDLLDTTLATSASEAKLRGALTQAALSGAPSAFPTLSDSSLEALRSRARSVLAELNRRVAEATAAITPTEVVNAVFGREFVFLRRFKPANSAALGDALTTGPVLGSDRHPIEKWFQCAAQVRAPLGRMRKLNLLSGALGAPTAQVKVAQLPHVPTERWVALPFDGGPRPPSGRLSLVLEQANAARADAEWAGLLLDEWTEVIPSTSELTGIAFNYDDPDSEAPQAILIAVPAVPGGVDGHWDLPSLIDTLRETLDLAKIRAVDSELLGSLSQLLPAIYLATNPRDETVSTDFSTRRIADPVLIS